MSTHKLNAIKNTFPDLDLEIQKEDYQSHPTIKAPLSN